MVQSVITIRGEMDTFHKSITHFKLDIDKIIRYLEAVTTHQVTALLVPPFSLRNVLAEVEKAMTPRTHLNLA